MTNTFKPGDKVRRTRPHMAAGAHAPTGYEFTVGTVGHNTLYEVGQSEFGHNVGNVELVEPARAFKVGDIVKLTGSGWGARAGLRPAVGSEHEIIEVQSDGATGKINVGKRAGERDYWFVYATKDPNWGGRWGAEIITPEPDATGYPVGTARAEKAVPETADIKAEFAGGDTAKLALFNRWYERELEEAREESARMAFVNGRREGFKAGWDQRGELEAADLAVWERELLGLNPAPKPVVVQSAREFVEALPVGTRIRTSVERGSTEYVRVPDGILVTKESPDQPRGDFGEVYSLPRQVSTIPNFYEIIE